MASWSKGERLFFLDWTLSDQRLSYAYVKNQRFLIVLRNRDGFRHVKKAWKTFVRAYVKIEDITCRYKEEGEPRCWT